MKYEKLVKFVIITSQITLIIYIGNIYINKISILGLNLKNIKK